MNYDIIIIGSGPGGYVAAIRGSQLGKKVAIVEKAELGGICLNWGCIPTKALLKSAQVYKYLNNAQDFGINVPENIGFEFPNVVQRSRGVADRMSKGVQFLMKKNKIDIIKGEAKVLPGKKVLVTNENEAKEYQADNIIIATGARSRELPALPQDGKKVIGYRGALALEKLPKSMIVVGSGAIGVEFAHFYHSLGTEVTIVEFLPRIVPVEDEDVSKQLQLSFKKSGIKILTNAEVTQVDTSGDLVKATVKTAKGEEVLEAEVVLSAVGVVPNTENIGLEEVGIATERGKIVINDYCQTSVPGYYAIGDVVKGADLAHLASAQGILAAEKIAGLEVEPIDYGNIPGCTYCSPEIASVGLTEAKAKEAGYEVKVGKFPFSANGKAVANGATDGFVKVVFDAKYGEWLGCHMIGDGVTEMIAEAVVARKLETTGHEIMKSVHAHPTMAEAIMEAVEDAYGHAIHI
ncbi:dihydrolipoyl dehydrogenase [Weeksella virosa]|uniref:Dihydrolipoyl dehydrogenase n=1 Tax=Weeksella virosa (strain ATCC 43766 / DSM 16922 / JCM 21250 / CCUG 30538 / CDC 9751 / IAM 14551 / NBRC 16016 / NCTC 11634 / CL345/78) TaxID=865938 RepID=F0NZI8_WEEVC|nr:dihydrolipoyl dehydrogenase [Weeksella virosa]ADX68335.1 dihydrolipoamide dehydrogenase [Weeksella virosa DSM 16922]MDK7674707.1 dihydrolipoyl dehydrogenase [Weeksella virosa]SUP54654.1 Dihydrolipoyl dehydrogenase [Weeksella virosa]VEH64024.1 Dihydrolipoyl dehydrogenase [Weeksella virosa]